MLLDICLGTRTAWKILFVIMSAPGKAIARKQINDMTKTGHRLDKYLTLLERFQLIVRKKQGKKFLYSFNLTSAYAEQLILLYKQERKDYNAVDFEIINILRDFVYGLTQFDFKNIRKLLLFGSYAKRTYHETSDIDVAILTTEETNPGEKLLHTDLIDQLEKRFGKEIQVHYFTETEFEKLRKSGNKLVNEIAADGLVLVG
ncbi:MAG: nucleotidyltransferase domain-containing protein [Candidatus Aenigmarchaeota archaeon]|nr:nucleotidyltransferase domain-containing protein [Candidatus Aenigmarchaeota archaeon]